MEDRGIDGVPDQNRVAELEPELEVLLEAEAGLKHRRPGERSVELRNAGIGAVVEAAVDADRSVDSVHHPATVARKPPQAAEVEVERVEETDGGGARQPVDFELVATRSELAGEGAHELVSTPAGSWSKLVKDREIGSSSTRQQPVGFGSRTVGKPKTRAPGSPRKCASVHPEHASFDARRLTVPSRVVARSAAS